MTGHTKPKRNKSSSLINFEKNINELALNHSDFSRLMKEQQRYIRGTYRFDSI